MSSVSNNTTLPQVPIPHIEAHATPGLGELHGQSATFHVPLVPHISQPHLNRYRPESLGLNCTPPTSSLAYIELGVFSTAGGY